MNMELRAAIIEQLEAQHRRATYGALAGLVGGIAQGVMQGLHMSPQNSFVVAMADGNPTGYPDVLKHPQLYENEEVIEESGNLESWLLEVHPPSANWPW